MFQSNKSEKKCHKKGENRSHNQNNNSKNLTKELITNLNLKLDMETKLAFKNAQTNIREAEKLKSPLVPITRAVSTIGNVGIKAAAHYEIKLAQKAIEKSSLAVGGKKIPVIGAVIGLGFGIYRFIKGEKIKALGEIASGAASCIPVYGTAASLVIDGFIIAHDSSNCI